MGFAGGSDAAVVSFLAHLVLAIAVTTPLIVFVDKPDIADLRRISVPAATVARRVIEIAAISTIIAVLVLALAPGSVILPISLAGIAFGKALPSLLASLSAVAVASALAWLLATQSVALPVAVIEGAGFGSLRRSWRLTRGHRWRIAALLGPLVLVAALLWLYMAEAVAPPSCPLCMFERPITISQRMIDIGGRSLVLGPGLGVAMVMMTRIYRRLVVICGMAADPTVQNST
jgi:hypothetical protein